MVDKVFHCLQTVTLLTQVKSAIHILSTDDGYYNITNNPKTNKHKNSCSDNARRTKDHRYIINDQTEVGQKNLPSTFFVELSRPQSSGLNILLIQLSSRSTAACQHSSLSAEKRQFDFILFYFKELCFIQNV